MAPFHPLRYETRAFVARALAAFAVFCTISLVLLAGSAPGPIATATAKDKGDSSGVNEHGNGNGNGHGYGHDDDGDEDGDDDGNGNGGGGKWDPPDPEEPEAPPTPTEPTPAPEPDPAPSGNGEDDDDDDGGRPDGEEVPEETGAGKGNPADPEPEPQGNVDPTAPAEPETPVTPETPGTGTPGQPQAIQLGSEGSRRARANRIRFQRPDNGPQAQPSPGQVAGVGGTVAEFQPAPAAGAPAFERVGRAQGGGDGSANPTDRRARPNEAKRTKTGPPIIREIPRFVNDVPAALQFALAVTGVLSFLLGFAYLLTTIRNRSLARQRRDLLQEVGLLQSALLPPVPDRVGGLRTSVA